MKVNNWHNSINDIPYPWALCYFYLGSVIYKYDEIGQLEAQSFSCMQKARMTEETAGSSSKPPHLLPHDLYLPLHHCLGPTCSSPKGQGCSCPLSPSAGSSPISSLSGPLNPLSLPPCCCCQMSCHCLLSHPCLYELSSHYHLGTAVMPIIGYCIIAARTNSPPTLNCSF